MSPADPTLEHETNAAGSLLPQDSRFGPRARLAAEVALFAALVAAAVIFFPKALEKLENGDVGWLVLAALLELATTASFALGFIAVFRREPHPVPSLVSTRVSLASLAAALVLPASGAGALAFSAWALRRRGLGRRLLAVRTIAFGMLVNVFGIAAVPLLAIVAISGALPHGLPPEATIIPGVIIIGVGLSAWWFARRGVRWPPGTRRRRWGEVLASIAPPAAREALSAGRTPFGFVGAVGYWLFDAVALWCSFNAFGLHPSMPKMLMVYLIGVAAGNLPLPGGLGGVEAAMIAAATAAGLDEDAATATVLAYRVVALWLPAAVGALAWFGLEQRAHLPSRRPPTTPQATAAG